MRDSCGDGNVLYLHCINADIPVVILCYSFARCHHKGKLVKDTWDLSILFLRMWICNYLKVKFFKKYVLGFPGGAVVESPPANAGDTGSSPGLGGSHVPRSDWVRGPQLLSLCVWSLCSTTREAEIVRGPCTAMKSGPHSPQLEKALARKRGLSTAKNK